MKKTTIVRAGAMTVGALLLASAGAAVATADEATVGAEGVEVNVNVTDRYPSGILALTVDAESTTLDEVDSGDPQVRQFEGQLPTVTVTDTRAEVPDVPWTVRGTATDFEGDNGSISSDALGWSPVLVDDDGSANIEAGGDVDPGIGLTGAELLYANFDQSATYDQGAWSATAGLNLQVPAAELASGDYTSVLTLSLFE